MSSSLPSGGRPCAWSRSPPVPDPTPVSSSTAGSSTSPRDWACRPCARCSSCGTETARRHCGDDADVALDAVELLPPGSRPRARHRRRAQHAQPRRRGRRVARHRAGGARVSAALPPIARQPGRARRRIVGSASVAPARLRRRAGSRHRPPRAIPHRGDCARRGRRLRLLQRRQRARLPVTHQPVHGREELPAHRRVRTVVDHA